MENITLEIKRPALSEVLSGKFDNNYELLKRLSSKGDLTSHNVFVIIAFIEKILKKALAIVNTEYKA